MRTSVLLVRRIPSPPAPDVGQVGRAIQERSMKMKYTKEQVKYIVAIYSVGMSIMSMLVPVPIISQIAKAFPNENIAMVQMCIGIIPLFMAVSALCISAFLVQRVYKRYIVLFCHILLTLAGLSVLVLHDSLQQVLAASAVVGLSIGGMQNGTDAIIADYFEGSKRSSIMGVFSTFVALGGILWTIIAGFLATQQWYLSYAVYALNIPFIILEFILLPKGHLEPKHKTNVLAGMPKEVVIITIVNFVFVLCFQVFQTNSSLLVAQRNLGGTAESGERHRIGRRRDRRRKRHGLPRTARRALREAARKDLGSQVRREVHEEPRVHGPGHGGRW